MISYELMGFFIAILVIFILSINISYIINKKIEYVLPLTVAFISLTLYVCSFFESRPVGVILIFLALAASTIFSIYKNKHNNGSIKEVVKSAGLIYFVLMIVFACIVSYKFMFNAWDEFSHWGLVLKNIFLSGGFGDISGSTTYSYPTGVSMFLSFFTHFSNIFSEPNALRGILIFSFSQMVIIFIKVKHNDWKKILLISSILLSVPVIFFSDFYSTIYVDALMGLIFCNILYFNYLYRKKDLFYAIYMSLQFYLLANTKQIGIGLVLIAFLAILIDFLCSRKVKPIKEFLLKTRKELLFTFMPLVTGVLTNLSWILYLKYHSIQGIIQVSGLKLSDVLDLIRGIIPEYRNLTTINFVTYLFSQQQFGIMPFSYFLLAAISIFVMYYVYKKRRSKQKEIFTLQLSAFIGFFVYLGIILFLYMFVFSEHEATRLASVQRYIGAYSLGLLLFCVFILIDFLVQLRHERNFSSIKLVLLSIIIFCFVPTASLLSDTVFSLNTNANRRLARSAYNNAEQYTSMLNPTTDRIYIISQANDGHDYWRLCYIFSPVQISPNYSWSLGAPYSPTDIWTINKTASEWSSDLKSYTYVYIQKVDDRFINDFGQLFENIADIKATTMYSVNNTEEGIVLKIVTATN